MKFNVEPALRVYPLARKPPSAVKVPFRFIVPLFSAMVPVLAVRFPEVSVSVPVSLLIAPAFVQLLAGDSVSVPAPLLAIVLPTLVFSVVGLTFMLALVACSVPLFVAVVL